MSNFFLVNQNHILQPMALFQMAPYNLTIFLWIHNFLI